MTDLALRVGTRYKAACGEIVKIVGLLDPDNYDKSINGSYTEAKLYEQGYRFKSSEGDSYLPNGGYDIDEEDNVMNLVEAVSSEYAVEHKLSDMAPVDLKKITATHPEEVLALFKINLPYATPLRVYELIEVKPENLEKAVVLGR